MRRSRDELDDEMEQQVSKHRRTGYSSQGKTYDQLRSSLLSHRPLHAAAMEYGLDYVAQKREEAYTNVPPKSYSKQLDGDLSFSLLTADILCAYFSSPKSQTGFSTLLDERMLQNKSLEEARHPIFAQLFGYVPIATSAVFAGGVNPLMEYMALHHDGVATVASVAMATPLALPLITGATTLGIAYALQKQHEKKAAKRQSEAAKQIENEKARMLHGYTELKDTCVSLYGALCKKHGVSFSKNESPYLTREKLIDHFRRMDVNWAKTYLQLARDIVTVGSNEKDVDRFTIRWFNCLKEVPGTEVEVGLLASLLFKQSEKLAQTDPTIKPAQQVETIVHSLLNRVFAEDRELYKRALISCAISMMGTTDEEFTNSVRTATLPFNEGYSREAYRDRAEKLVIIKEAYAHVVEAGKLGINVYSEHYPGPYLPDTLQLFPLDDEQREPVSPTGTDVSDLGFPSIPQDTIVSTEERDKYDRVYQRDWDTWKALKSEYLTKERLTKDVT